MAGDLDGDNAPDLAAACFSIAEVPTMYRLRVLYGNGDGTMRDAVDLPLQAESTVQRIIDVNGDGLPDVVLRSGSDVIVFLNTSR